jgi:FkbM family methyltransferase
MDEELGMRPRSWIQKSLRQLSHWLVYQYRVSRRKIVEIAGIRIRVGRHMSPGVERAVTRGGMLEDELRLIGMILTPQDIALEIGAGLGVVSAYCAKRLGSGCVFACEADPDLEPRIRETYGLNGVQPTLEMCAVRAMAGRVTIYRSKHLVTSGAASPGNGAQSIEVPGKALSYLVEKVRPTLLIVGEEGSAAELFDSARLPGVRKIVLELHERLTGEGKAKQVRGALAAIGFREDSRFSSRDHLVLCR